MMNIPRDVEKRTYELTYLLPASFTETEMSQIKDKVSKLVSKHKGEVIAVEDWGKKHMAYTLRHNGKRHDEAVYVFMTVGLESKDAQAFERDIYLMDQIMRHLFIIAQPVDETKEVSENA